jgi:hypothetical protein
MLVTHHSNDLIPCHQQPAAAYRHPRARDHTTRPAATCGVFMDIAGICKNLTIFDLCKVTSDAT